jgi:lipid-binding SYLF domain-containing protein
MLRDNRLRFSLATILVLISVRSEAGLFSPPPNPNQIVVDATNVLSQSVAMPSGLPQSMLPTAQGIVIVPNMVRGAFVIGGQFGQGVLLTRGPGGAWQAPRMVNITGASVGYQIGVQSTDLILIFRTPQSVANLLRGTLKVGVDASAAAGPVGRQASAATDLPMQAEILSYSRARGAFVGVSIDGSAISLDPATDATFYQPPGTIPPSATQLVQLLTALSSGGPAAVVPPTQETVAVVPNGPPGAPPTGPPALPVPQPVSKLEAARQQLDASSRQLAAGLDDQWKQYLALPPEVYIPNHAPSVEAIEQAISRYEAVSENPQYAGLTDQPAFQSTLKSLWQLGAAQQGAQQKLRLPPPPVSVKAP